MPSETVRALHCLVRSQGRQVILLTARKAVANLLLVIHYKALKLATEHEADVGGWAAAERVDHALTKLDSITLRTPPVFACSFSVAVTSAPASITVPATPGAGHGMPGFNADTGNFFL